MRADDLHEEFRLVAESDASAHSDGPIRLLEVYGLETLRDAIQATLPGRQLNKAGRLQERPVAAIYEDDDGSLQVPHRLPQPLLPALLLAVLACLILTCATFLLACFSSSCLLCLAAVGRSACT